MLRVRIAPLTSRVVLPVGTTRAEANQVGLNEISFPYVGG
jgi:hypothetical protein